MKIRCAALLVFVLSWSAQATAQDERCPAAEGKAVTSLDELPAQVLDLLDRARTGTAGIADIGGKFNPTDVIVDNSVPMRRLVTGVAGPQCIWLTVEYGGIGHYQKQLEYRLDKNQWVQTRFANVERAPLLAPPSRH